MIAPAYVYRATCDRVKDGDTFVARVDLGFYVSTTVPVRIAGVNAPELHGATKYAGQAAKSFLLELIGNVPLLLQSHKDDRSFERWVCDIWLADGRSVADVLIAAGFGIAA